MNSCTLEEALDRAYKTGNMPIEHAMIQKLKPYTMIHPVYLNVYLLLARQVSSLPGALVQCGCYMGGSAAALRLALGPREVWLFDSFEGMPQPGYNDGKRAAWKYQMKGPGWHACSPDDVRAAFAVAEIPLDDVTIVQGWFQDTAPDAEVGPIAFLHLDADWYASTKIPLETFYDRVQPGGIVLIDDYGGWAGCKRAVNEFRTQRNISAELKKATGSAFYWKVP